MGYAEIAGIALFHGFAHWAGPAAVDGLWQGAAVAAGLAICLRLAPRIAASHRFAMWAGAFGLVAGLPALPGLVRMLAGFAGGAGEGAQAAAAGASHAWLRIDPRWSLAVAGAWLALSAYRAVDLGIHTARLRRLWKSARPVEDGLGALPDVRGVRVCTTSELDRPSVIGFLAPRILIPEWLLERLTREELEQVILHESEHLRRGDDWTNLAQKLCLMAFPLNPALQWMDRRLAKEREMACDEGVVRVTGAPRAYAACLTSLAERGLENNLARAEALSLGAFERRPELVHRVHSILFGGKMLGPVAGRALVALVGCGLIFGSVELARCPQVVAFVPEYHAPALTAMAAQAEPVRAEYAVARPEDFRAVNAEAVMPAERMGMMRAARERATEHVDRTREMKNASGAGAGAGVESRAGSGAESGTAPHESLVKAVTPASRTAQVAQPQELLMVTTWQLQTTYKAQNVADYDTGAAAASSGKNADRAATRPANTIAVTRMFLGVYRASQTAQAASRAAGKTAQPAATNTDLKTLPNQTAKHAWGAVPFGDGWLVIEL